MSEPAYEKVSVTLPRALVDSARARAGTRGFSAYVAEGLRLAEHMADLDDFLASHVAGHGRTRTPRQTRASPSRGGARPRQRRLEQGGCRRSTGGCLDRPRPRAP